MQYETGRITEAEAISFTANDAMDVDVDKISNVDARSVHSSPLQTAFPTSAPPEPSWREKVVQNMLSNSSRTACRPWHSTWIRFGPLSGIASLTLAAMSLIAALGILIGSDGEKVGGWTVPPSTYLAIFTAIANLSVRYAVTQGVVITWWRRARRGSTISSLHNDWKSGTTLRGAVSAGRHTGLLGLAAIFATLVFIDGPLLQRASTVIAVPNDATVSLSLFMAPELPHGYTGVWLPPGKLGGDLTRMASAFNETMPTSGDRVSNYFSPFAYPNKTAVFASWTNNDPLAGVVLGCAGECTAKIRAPGLFPTDCKIHRVNSETLLQYNLTQVEEGEFAPPVAAQGLIINPGLILGENEEFNLITGFSTFDGGYDSCNGTFEWKVCTFVSGIGEYDVLIRDDKIIMTDLANPKLVAYANNTATIRTWSNLELAYESTLGGVVQYMQRQWEAYIVYFTAENQTSVYSSGSASALVFEKRARRHCINMYDPFDQIVNSMNKLMVYFGASAAQVAQTTPDLLVDTFDPGVSTESTVVASVLGDVNVYHTDYWWFFGAALIEVMCIGFVFPTYWGYWRMGRPVSLSPLEMARAFKSPLLAEYSSNSNGGDLAAAADGRTIRYGLMVEGEKSELGFGDVEAVTSPAEGMKFDV